MLSKVISFALNGLEGVPVEVETDINKGMVSYELVGLPDAAVKESKERVRSAVKNSAPRSGERIYACNALYRAADENPRAKMFDFSSLQKFCE